MFDCVARMGWLNRMTQFKEKAGKDRENASVGLFNYPVLMAADILVYRATHVPVGDDQKQHLELARDIAQKFNNDFSESIAANGHEGGFFPLPEPLIQGPATRVMSLRDGTKKMSKSDPSEYSLIAIMDDADTVAQKIRKAKTDRSRCRARSRGSPAGRRPTISWAFSRASTTRRRPTCSPSMGGAQFSAFKSALTELIVARLAPIRAEMLRLARGARSCRRGAGARRRTGARDRGCR